MEANRGKSFLQKEVIISVKRAEKSSKLRTEKLLSHSGNMEVPEDPRGGTLRRVPGGRPEWSSEEVKMFAESSLSGSLAERED